MKLWIEWIRCHGQKQHNRSSTHWCKTKHGICLTYLRKNLVGCKWIFKHKRDADRQIQQLKTRLVAQGYFKKFGIDFDDVFAPVAKYSNDLNLVVHQMDLNAAFLNGAFDEKIYMQQSDAFVNQQSLINTSKILDMFKVTSILASTIKVLNVQSCKLKKHQ